MPEILDYVISDKVSQKGIWNFSQFKETPIETFT